ncbi:MAG: hypothetical protein MRJ93_00310 [Nitrososphaeraceae archaeon]|nr:hypothetical protein [Nitrososphaeraceae archaeon]
MGGNFKAHEVKVLNPLIADCVYLELSEKDALKYIEVRLGRKISPETYYRRKELVDTGEYAKDWLNQFTKIGFIVSHQEQLQILQTLQKNTFRDYMIEYNKPPEKRNEAKVQQLAYQIRENVKLIEEVSLGTPVLAQLKAKLEHAESISETQ